MVSKRIFALAVVGVAIATAAVLIARSFYPVDRSVTIHYTQHAQCGGYSEGTQHYTAGPNGTYIFFKIADIVNTANRAKDFVFDPHHLYVDGSTPHNYMGNVSVPPLSTFMAVSTTVPNGQIRTVNGHVVTIVSGADVPDPSALAAQKDYRLAADPSGVPGQTINLVKGGSGPPWGVANMDCVAIRNQF